MQLKNSVINNVEQIVEDARRKAIRSVDFQRVLMYWRIGKVIFEEEQNGRHRAKYGSFLIRSISDKFLPIYGTGFSKRQLELNRQFYKLFPIANALRSQLSWTHYRMLIRINDPQKLEFYIAESTKNNWSARQLERQNVNYFDRFEKQSSENATIGIILCADKNDMMVKITLPENNHNIVASQYQLYLPSEKQLLEEVQKECI
jgi:hypothetical protein